MSIQEDFAKAKKHWKEVLFVSGVCTLVFWPDMVTDEFMANVSRDTKYTVHSKHIVDHKLNRFVPFGKLGLFVDCIKDSINSFGVYKTKGNTDGIHEWLELELGNSYVVNMGVSGGEAYSLIIVELDSDGDSDGHSDKHYINCELSLLDKS